MSTGVFSIHANFQNVNDTVVQSCKVQLFPCLWIESSCDLRDFATVLSSNSLTVSKSLLPSLTTPKLEAKL